MKKRVLGLTTVAAVVALRRVVKRRMAHKMREHWSRMAAHCKEMSSAEAPRREAMHRRRARTTMKLAVQHEQPAEPLAAA